MHDIFTTMKAKRAAIARLQDELSVLERAVALLEGDVADQADEVGMPDPAQRRVFGAAAKGHFSATSQVGLTVAVLRDAGSPLHITDIIKRIEDGGQKVNKMSLVGSISRLVKERRTFFRKKPNVFGLSDWQLRPPSLPVMSNGNGGLGNAGQSRRPAVVSKTTAEQAARH
jgi:hypothetical protein